MSWTVQWVYTGCSTSMCWINGSEGNWIWCLQLNPMPPPYPLWGWVAVSSFLLRDTRLPWEAKDPHGILCPWHLTEPWELPLIMPSAHLTTGNYRRRESPKCSLPFWLIWLSVVRVWGNLQDHQQINRYSPFRLKSNEKSMLGSNRLK